MKHRLSALFMAGALAMTMPVCADISIDDVKIDADAGTVTVTGKAEGGEDILITASSDNAKDYEFFDKLGYQDTIKSGEDGTFEISFKIKNADLYTVTAATKEENAKQKITFTNKDNLNTAAGIINASTNLESDLKANKLELGLSIDGVDAEPNWSGLATRINHIDTTDANKTILDLQRELICQYVEDDKIENVFEVNKYLDIFAMMNNAVFEDILSEENELYATELISGKAIKDYDDFSAKITDAMILAVVKDPNGYGNLKDTLVAHAGLIGINTSGVNEQVYKDLCNKTFNNLNELKIAFNNLVYYDDGGSSGGGKGSGGGGSSLGGGKVSFAATPVTPGTNPVQSAVFNDLGNYAWAKDSVEKLAKLGVVSGRGNGNFAPADNVTRSEFVKMIVLALDIKASDKEIAFEDVKEGGWDYSYVKAAFSAGIINGVNDIYFGGNEKISRQDMAVIISRALSYAGRGVNGVSNEKFVDDTYIASYSRDAVYALRQAGVMQGDDLGRFNPLNPANRAEAAKVICSVLN